MANRIELRWDFAAVAAATNEVLGPGEPFFEIDTGLWKRGDNVGTPYNALPYMNAAGGPLALLTLLEQLTEPATPPAGQLRIYAKTSAGRMVPKFKGPAGMDIHVQPAIFSNGVFLQSPGVTTAPTVLGGGMMTLAGTRTHPAIASNTRRTAMFRWQVLSAATANSVAAEYSGIARYLRGDGPTIGGFYLRTRFALGLIVPLQRAFMGMEGSVAAPVATQAPNAMLNCIGAGFDSGDANWSIYANDATGPALKVDTGIPCNDAGEVYDLAVFAAPGATVATVELRTASGSVEFSYQVGVADLPVSTLLLAPRLWLNNGGTAAAVQLDIARVYVETDY